MKRFIILIQLVACILISYSSEKGKIEVPLRFDRYYTYEEVVQAIEALNKAYPELTKIDVVGESEEGRKIYALTINNPKTGEELTKPGVYVDGNIHGNEIQAGEVCLYYANMLLTKYGENEKVTNTLRKNGVSVLFDSIKTTTHVKMVVVDRRYSFVGSHNLTHSALYYNHEMSLLIESPQLANDFIQYIETLSH